MVRTVIAVIVSYVLIFGLISVTFIAVFLIMGVEWSFKPGSFEASNAWNVTALIASFLVAVVGGFVCRLIAKAGKGPRALAVVVFVLGLIFAIPTLFANQANANQVRSPNLSPMEAMTRATQPAWVPFTFPVLGAAGVLLGGRLKRSA